MAWANLNKSKKVLTSTTTASKYIPKRPKICINWNPPFQTQIYLVKVPLNVNIVKQDLANKKTVWKFYEVRSERGGFQFIQILGLLGMCFDAVVVKVKTLVLFRLALASLCVYQYVLTNCVQKITFLSKVQNHNSEKTVKKILLLYHLYSKVVRHFREI